MFESVQELIEAYDTILLHRHKQPDGDALGSQIGLKHLIKDRYPHKQVYMLGDAAGRYSFMTDSLMNQVEDSVFAGALSIILDCGAAHLISDARYTLSAATARIDHHLFTGAIAQEEVIQSDFESCCGLITAFAIEQGYALSPLSAAALYTGMITDSGRFRYDSTTAGTLQRAAFLLEQPFSANDIYTQLYADTLSSLQLRARFTLSIQLTAHKVAYIYTDKATLAGLDADAFTVSRGMVSTMSDIKGVDIWVNFTETEEGVLCELRSRACSINPIAVKYGGGGHAKASGATVADKQTAMAMLYELDALSASLQ